MKTVLLRYILLLTLTFLVPLSFFAQDKEKNTGKTEQKKTRVEEEADEDEEEPVKHWEFGLNFGVYFPSKYPANYYNGSPRNLNTINYVMSNTYWYRDIMNDLHASYKVAVYELPTNMHYKTALMGGLFIRFNVDKKNGIFVEANYTQLKAEDQFTVEVDTITYLALPDLRLFPIIGKEERIQIDLAYQRTFWLKSKINFFVQAGMMFNYTHVLKSAIIIPEKEYSMINIYGNQNYVPNTSLQEFEVIQGGFGYGLYLGAGAGFPITDMFNIEPGFYMHYNNVDLEGYRQFSPSFGVYIRFLLSNII